MTVKSVAASATKALGALIATGLLVFAGDASAGDRDGWRNGRDDAGRRHHHRRSVERSERPIYGPAGLPSVLPRIGTYTGGLSAVRIPGNGVYIQVDHNRGARRGAGNPIIGDTGQAKIIHVTPSTNRRGCSYEAGVCVVRP